MSDTLHPSSAPTEAGGESAIDQVAELLRGEAEPEQREESVDYEAATDTEEFEDASGEYEDGDAESEDPNRDEDQFEGDEEGLAALASELGVESDKLGLDEDGQIVVTMTVNGEKKQVTLTAAISGAQYRAANDQKAQKLSEERRTFETERQQVADAYTQQLQHIQGLGEMLQGKLTQEYQSIDWERLRVTDPGEWTAKQREFELRNQELQQAGMALGQRMKEQEEQRGQWEAQERAKILQSERRLMVESNPEWADEGRMKNDLTEIINYAKSNGFPDEELSEVIHSRHVDVLRKAWLWDKGQTVAEKRSKTPPKMQRAANGRFVGKKDTRLNRLVERAKSAKGGEKREAQAEAVLALLGK